MKWEGFIYSPYSQEDYSFRTTLVTLANDVASLTIEDSRIIDEVAGKGKGYFELLPGSFYKLDLEMVEYTSESEMHLFWANESQPLGDVLVPSSNLFTWVNSSSSPKKITLTPRITNPIHV